MKKLLIIVFVSVSQICFGQNTPSPNLADYLPKDTTTKIHVNQTIEYNIRFQTEFYKQINAYRKANGKKPLQPDSVLEASALQHSKYQAYEGEMTHIETNKNNPYYVGERVFWRNGNGENVAYGPGGTNPELSALFAFAIWKSSPGHDRNMLNDYKFVGVAVYDGYCTTVFGI